MYTVHNIREIKKIGLYTIIMYEKAHSYIQMLNFKTFKNSVRIFNYMYTTNLFLSEKNSFISTELFLKNKVSHNLYI